MAYWCADFAGYKPVRIVPINQNFNFFENDKSVFFMRNF
jgi:hypothetical protein